MDLFPPSVQSLICDDHLCRVVNDVVKELDILFAQTVQLCKQLGMVKLGHVAIDGTEIKANAFCQFFGRCTTNENGRGISRHPYEKELSRMRQKLDSESGKPIYGKRKYTVELPFGHTKSIMGFTSFMLRGKQKVTGEFELVSVANNLRKTWLYLKANQQNLAGMCLVPGC